MVRKREPLPNENELVICTISRVFSHGAFAKLDEYNGREGFIHISEIASTWIKNIRDFVKEGQKTVAKVLNVDRKKGYVDLSLRRVTDAQRKNKMQEWKRAQKAEKLLELMAKEVGKSLDEAYEEVGFKLEEKYGEIYSGFEEITIEGEKALEGLDIPSEWKEPLIRIVRDNVEIPLVKIRGFLDLRSHLPNGVEVIKKALIKAREYTKKKYKDIELEIRYAGSPRFMINVAAADYKTAEEALRFCAEKAISIVKTKGGKGEFIRES